MGLIDYAASEGLFAARDSELSAAPPPSQPPRRLEAESPVLLPCPQAEQLLCSESCKLGQVGTRGAGWGDGNSWAFLLQSADSCRQPPSSCGLPPPPGCCTCGWGSHSNLCADLRPPLHSLSSWIRMRGQLEDWRGEGCRALPQANPSSPVRNTLSFPSCYWQGNRGPKASALAPVHPPANKSTGLQPHPLVLVRRSAPVKGSLAAGN